MTIAYKILIVAAALAGAAPASALITTATYTGKVGFGFDTTGMFGVAGASLDGADYVMVYTVDDAAPGAMQTSSATSSSITGSGANSPVHMAITVNGITHTINGNAQGTAQRRDEVHASGLGYVGLWDQVRHVSNEYSFVPGVSYHAYDSETYILSYAQDFATSPDFRAALSYGGTTGSDSLYNLVQFNDFDYLTGTQINYAYLNLNIGTLRIASVPTGGAVPEPEGWAMMVLGLAGIGAAQRIRARRVQMRSV